MTSAAHEMDLKLKASKRTVSGRHVRRLRGEGVLPGVVYGHRSASEAVALDSAEFRRVYAKAGRTHLVDLELDGDRGEKVLIREVQIHPRFDGPQHVDLLRIDLKEKLQIEVPVTITGDTPEAVKQGEADLMILLHSLKVECLPGDIPESIEVDVSGLAEIDDAIRVHDLHFADGITILAGPEEMVVKVQAHRVVEEPVAEEEEGAEAVEGAEGAEAGEAAAEGERPAEAPEES